MGTLSHKASNNVLVYDAQVAMGLLSYRTVFAVAMVYTKHFGGGYLEKTIEMFDERSYIPQWLEDFLIDYLSGRINDLVIDFTKLKARKRGDP